MKRARPETIIIDETNTNPAPAKVQRIDAPYEGFKSAWDLSREQAVERLKVPDSEMPDIYNVSLSDSEDTHVEWLCYDCGIVNDDWNSPCENCGATWEETHSPPCILCGDRDCMGDCWNQDVDPIAGYYDSDSSEDEDYLPAWNDFCSKVQCAKAR